MKGDIPKQSS